ncbi:MAG: hypothetical protein ABIL46_01195 [candidate division WOR-3 bacterium]
MHEILKNSLILGLGIAGLGRKKLSKIYNTLKAEGEALKEEIPGIKKRWQKFETTAERFDEMCQRIASRLNIATKAELSELNKKIERLLKQKSASD